MYAVHRLDVRASLDDPAPAIAQARVEAASGDESWEQWAAEAERGEALVIRLDVTVAAEDRSSEPIRTANWGVFVERELHPPQLEQQVAEMASKDYTRIAAQLQERGHDVDAADLAEMYVHVELDPELKKLLTDEEAQRQAMRAGDPGAEAGGYEEAISS